MVSRPIIPVVAPASTPDSRTPPTTTAPVNSPPAVHPTTGTTVPSPQISPAPPTPSQRQIAALKDLFLSGRITAEQYENGQTLLNSDAAALDEYDSSRRVQYATLADGKLAPEKLAASLSAIETPQQKAARLNLEASQRAAMLRKNRIADLLADARSKQTAEKGTQGLALVNEILGLDPSNAEALSLKSRIESAMADAASRAEEDGRWQAIASLIQQARASDNPENGQTALASLGEASRARTRQRRGPGPQEKNRIVLRLYQHPGHAIRPHRARLVRDGKSGQRSRSR